MANKSSDQRRAKRLEDMLVQVKEPHSANSTLDSVVTGADKLTDTTSQWCYNTRVQFALHSCGVFDTNGYAVRTNHIIRALEKADTEVFAMTRPGYPWDLPQHIGEPIVPSSLGTMVKYTHTAYPRKSLADSETEYVQCYAELLREIASRNEACLIHAHSNYLNGRAANLAAQQAGMRSVYEMRGLWHVTRASHSPPYYGTEHYRYAQGQELLACAEADAVVTLSHTLKRWLCEHGIASDKIAVVANACNEVQPRSEPNNAVPCVGYVGSFVSYEGLELLVQAIAQLNAQKLSCRGLIVGDGPVRNSCEKLAKKLGVFDRLEFTGRLTPEAALATYNQMDVAIIPRLRTSVTELVAPLKPLEIMGRGVPLVAADLPPIAEFVVDGENAILFEPGSLEDLTSKLAWLLQDEDKRREISSAGLVNAGLRSWQANAKAYQSLYRNLA